MTKFYSYKDNQCWWCSNIGDSGEHRHKKSDVKRIFGNKFEGDPVILKDDKQIFLQGPDSKFLKFKKVLCQQCNNSKSQSFDRSYDKFITYIESNYDTLLTRGDINFQDIFSSEPLINKNNLIRYYLKGFCCRLASNNIYIESDLIDFLNGVSPLNYVYFKFELRPDIHAFLNKADLSKENLGNIYLSPLRYFKGKNDNDYSLTYQFYNLQWLRIYTFYGKKMNEENYPGYTEYNETLITPIEAKYSIHPDQVFQENHLTKENMKDDKNETEWLEQYLATDVFKY